MKQKLVIAIVVCVVTSLPAVYAQKVVVVDGAKVIIDCTGMPAGAVTAAPKARTTTGTNTTPAGAGLTDIASEESNEQLYQRFEVSKVDNSTGTTWKEAVDLCNGLTQNGTTGWRLPTLREIQLMWILKPALEKQAGFATFNATEYWNASHSSGSTCWYVNLGTGITRTISKTKSFRVRCIRDI